MKSQFLAGFTEFIAKVAKSLELGSLGSRTKLTKVTSVQKLSLSIVAVFIRKLGFSRICWVCHQSNKTQKAGFTGFWNPAYLA